MVKKPITLLDVAQFAKTSPSTVSRIINGADYPVSVELRERITHAAQFLNYIPKKSSRSAQKSLSLDIAVMIPNISNQFYPQTVLGIESVLHDSGYNLLLFNTLRSKQKENAYLEMLCQRKVRGVIISMVDVNIAYLNNYIQKGMQFVLLDQKSEEVCCPSLNFDSRLGSRLAVQHFVEKRHTKIAFATTPLTRWTRAEIFKGYMEILSESNIAFQPEYVFESTEELEGEDTNYEVNAGSEMAGRFIETGCDATAILCVNDMLAFGVIKTLVKNGVRVPEDVSIIGFDDIPFASVYLPALTTIRYPSYDTGKLAAMVLLENMQRGNSQISLKMKMEPTLIERNTVIEL
jgi:LacI family transcriptional regulator